jgi:hypothetical protein
VTIGACVRSWRIAFLLLVVAACSPATSPPEDGDSDETTILVADIGPADTWCCACLRLDEKCVSSCSPAVGICEDVPTGDGCIGTTFETPDVDGLPDCGSQQPQVDGDLAGCPLTCVENIP